MTETETGPLTLTADDCAAIRGATLYVVRLEGDTVSLELTRKERPTSRRGYTPREGTSVELTRTIVGTAGTLTRATFVELYPDGAWRALALLVRPGDVLRLYARENGNGYLRAAECPYGKDMDGSRSGGWQGLYLDELCADIVRKGRTVVCGLVLAHTVCPDNSARAIRETRREVA